jgi:hypothetical protein
MARGKKHMAEQIVNLLRQVEVGVANGSDGSCVGLLSEHADHVWSYDFVSAKTHDGGRCGNWRVAPGSVT